MNFGPAEMAQTMETAKGLIVVTIAYSVGIGIVVGAIVALLRHRAADRSFRSGTPNGPVLPPVPAQEIEATAPHSPRSPAPRANGLLRLKLIDLLGIIILISFTGGGLFSYYTSKRLQFDATLNNQVVIQPSFPTIQPQQQELEVNSNQSVIQPSPPTIQAQPQVPDLTATQPVIQPSRPTIQPQQPFADVRAESINANLCEASSRHAIERTLSSAPTKELIKYVEGLKKGSYAFNWTISGHDAAKQLGFGRRFAATHGQVAEEVGARLARKNTVHIDEIIEYFSGILREEQSVDRLVADKDRHFPAVAYLRALQEGAVFVPVCASRYSDRAGHDERFESRVSCYQEKTCERAFR